MSTIVDIYCAGMQHVCASVAIVATQWQGRRAGLTATAVCSLAIDPPSMILCVNRQASAHGAIVARARFSVNFASDEQEAVARRFSGAGGPQGEARFQSSDWVASEAGIPVLRNGVAAFEYYLASGSDHRSHTIFIGKVVDVTLREDRLPLLYLRCQYLRLGRLLNQELIDDAC